MKIYFPFKTLYSTRGLPKSSVSVGRLDFQPVVHQVFPYYGSKTRAREKDPEEVKTSTGTMDSEIDVDIKDTSKSVPHSDASLNDTNLAAFELEQNTEDNLEHLFPKVQNIKRFIPGLFIHIYRP